jgi:hypothetical protein
MWKKEQEVEEITGSGRKNRKWKKENESEDRTVSG